MPQELKHRALQPNDMLAKGQQQVCEALERKIQKLLGDPTSRWATRRRRRGRRRGSRDDIGKGQYNN